ncbi:MAG: bifunctional riboflavin kinase/FAD synthetase [Stagnimonas sp.]|nr:bifunctional riboflavin kinase/FAD synthetase [Stagnimonas sp.]
MELIRGLHNLRPEHRGCVLSIGNYDGVHRGHQALLDCLRAQAGRLGLPATVLVFEPTPREYFSQAEVPPRVLTLRDKLAALAEHGVRRVVIARFDGRLAGLSGEEFVRRVIVAGLGARAVVVGDDFRFGARRSGDFALLRTLGGECGYVAEQLGTLAVQGDRCSSTALRGLLAEARLDEAAQLLGRRYSIRGPVRHGLKLGRQLDMPTANIALRRLPPLPLGVYAVRARIDGAARDWFGVASLGVRPTLGLSRCLLETHLFGEPGDIYGRLLQVEFQRYLRPELRFDSLDALKQQMHRDADEARADVARQPGHESPSVPLSQ